MKNSLLRVLAAALLLVFAVAVLAQSKEDYLDVYQVQVKPEKRAEFDAIIKKIADANRNNHGDQWETLESMYGEGNWITFISHRQSYADVESGMTAFNNAISKAFGAGASKMFAEFGSCLVSSRGELRRRRWDLSNAPADPAARDKIIGQSRFLRTSVIHVRPGRAAEFEAVLKQVKEARDKSKNPETVFVSQSMVGTEGTVYYVTYLKPSFAGFDGQPSMKELLGDEDYRNAMKVGSETIQNLSTVINRFVPEFSNASTEIAAAAPAFWNPKPAVAAKKPAGGKKTTAEAKN